MNIRPSAAIRQSKANVGNAYPLKQNIKYTNRHFTAGGDFFVRKNLFDNIFQGAYD